MYSILNITFYISKKNINQDSEVICCYPRHWVFPNLFSVGVDVILSGLAPCRPNVVCVWRPSEGTNGIPGSIHVHAFYFNYLIGYALLCRPIDTFILAVFRL